MSIERLAASLAELGAGGSDVTGRLIGASLSFGMASVHDLELARLRAMTASEKVAVMHSLWRQAWSLKVAGVQGHHPDWSAEQVAAEVREIFRRDPQ